MSLINVIASEKSRRKLPPPEPAPIFYSTPSYGMISTLPASYTVWKDPETVPPNIKETPLPEAFRIMGEQLNCLDYDFNLLSFWCLDIIMEALQTAQEEMKMGVDSQKIMLSWFTHLLSVLQNQNWTRNEAFGNIHNSILTGGDLLSHEGWTSRVKQEIGEIPIVFSQTKIRPESSTQYAYIHDMSNTVELLYSVFANAFQYEVIRQALCATESIQQSIMPHMIHYPKIYKTAATDEVPTSKKGKQKGPSKKDIAKEETASDNKLGLKPVQHACLLPLQEAVTEEYIYKALHPPPPVSEDDEK